MRAEQLVYTDRPRGKGLDPQLAGYQVKACSPDLGPELRTALQAVAMHYGDAVYRHAPRSATDRETSWRATTDSIATVPRDVLDEFPVIWSYDRLRDDRFALTRVCYRGFTHDGRTGNFLAHSIVFDPVDATAAGLNPLALARGGPFISEHPGDGTSMAAIDVAASQADADLNVLTTPPIKDRLPALLTALEQAAGAKRPVVICLDDWRRAAPIVEALLLVLPPSARARATFVTYESDRKWVPSTPGGGRPTDGTSPHTLIVHCGDPRAFDLRADEYKAGFAVFNFVESQFSELPPAGAFASFASASIAQGGQNRLKSLHALLEDLGLGRDPAAWNTLVPAADLHRDGVPADGLQSAVRALATVCADGDRAGVALSRVAPHCQRLARADRSDEIAALSSDLSKLAHLAEPAERGPFRDLVQSLASTAFREGRTRTAAALIRCSGPAWESMTFDVARDGLGGGTQVPAPAQANESDPTVELLLTALKRAESQPDGVSSAARLLVAVLRAAEKANRAGDLWLQLAESAIKPRLSGDWSDEKRALADDLLGALTPKGCPEGVAWLNLRLLEAAPPAGDEPFTKQLTAIARACPATREPAKLAEQAIGIARARFAGARERALAIGRMADAAHGSPGAAPFMAAFDDELKRDGSMRDEVREGLAEHDAGHVLARELQSDVLPWDGDEGPRRLQSFWDRFLAPNPKTLDVVCGHLAIVLAAPNGREALPLAAGVLTRNRRGTAAGVQALATATARALPLPATADDLPLLQALPDTINDPAANARVQVIRLLAELAERQALAATGFPSSDRRWAAVGTLGGEDRTRALAAGAELLWECGVTTPAEADAIIDILAAAGDPSPARVAGFASLLLRGRDKVSCVNTLMAFAHAGLQGTAPGRGALVAAVLPHCERGVRELLEAHLQRRPGRQRPVDARRLAEFCAEADLGAPAAPSDVSLSGIVEAAKNAAGPGTDAVVGKAKKWFGKILGGE